jgi:hypothetical protein
MIFSSVYRLFFMASSILEDSPSSGSVFGGQVSKYVERYWQGTNVILLDPDIAEEFPASESVNDALRRLAGRGGG